MYSNVNESNYMKLYCASCNKFVASIGGHVRKGTVMVCAECWERYEVSDRWAKEAREQIHNDPTVEKFRKMFHMK